MPHQLTTSYIKDSAELFRYYKKLVERALAQCPDEGLFTALDEESNCIAIIVKHMAGNMRSRWKDFLTSDGEKPDRNRDIEFEEPPKTRAELMELWESGWKFLFDALEPLSDADVTRTITIRHRASFSHAGNQSPDRSLLLPRRPNYLPRKTFRRPVRPVDRRHDPPQKVRRVQHQSRLRRSLSALTFKHLEVNPQT